MYLLVVPNVHPAGTCVLLTAQAIVIITAISAVILQRRILLVKWGGRGLRAKIVIIVVVLLPRLQQFVAVQTLLVRVQVERVRR